MKAASPGDVEGSHSRHLGSCCLDGWAHDPRLSIPPIGCPALSCLCTEGRCGHRGGPGLGARSGLSHLEALLPGQAPRGSALAAHEVCVFLRQVAYDRWPRRLCGMQGPSRLESLAGHPPAHSVPSGGSALLGGRASPVQRGHVTRSLSFVASGREDRVSGRAACSLGGKSKKFNKREM